MDFSEFLRRKGAEPRSRDPELEQARAQGKEFTQAAEAIEAFESKLEQALCPPVDSQPLLDDFFDQLDTPDANQAGTRSWPWLSIAASLVITVGVIGLVFNRAPPASIDSDDLQRYVMEHFEHDGSQVLARVDGGMSEGSLERVLTQLDVRGDDTFAQQVRYVKICPTPHGKGAHLVMQGETGPVTVLFMPETQVNEPLLMRFEDQQASVIALRAGSAAIIGPAGQSHQQLQTLLRESLQPLHSEA